MSTQQQQAPGQAAEHTGVEAVVDEVKERFTREWDSLKARARTAFAKLSEEDMESVKGRFDELRAPEERVGHGSDASRSRAPFRCLQRLGHFTTTA